MAGLEPATADELDDLANPYPGWSAERLQEARLALRDLVEGFTTGRMDE